MEKDDLKKLVEWKQYISNIPAKDRCPDDFKFLLELFKKKFESANEDDQQFLSEFIIKLAKDVREEYFKISFNYMANLSFVEYKGRFFKVAVKRFSLSPRAYFKILKVARTIADLDEVESITIEHLSEALQYRHREDVGI